MDRSIEVLYEDNHIIAINKKAGQIVQGDKTGDTPLSELVKEWLKEKYDKKGNVYLGVPHRLDRPVSGVVLFAKTSKSLSRLNEMFKNKTTKKQYLAICSNKPPKTEDLLQHYIFRDTKKNKSFANNNPTADSKFASLSYKHIGTSEKLFLLEIDLQTGRHHQIRCQLAAIGCPIRGDLKYGYPRSNKNAGINLHASKIELIHPVKQELISITAPTPNEKVWSIFTSLL